MALIPIVSVSADTNNTSSVGSVDNDTLNVIGNKVYATNSKQYIPEGISVYGGLEDKNYLLNVKNDDIQIAAAAKYWHSNTIRLQIAESNLFKHITKGKVYNAEFLQDIANQVSLAHEYNMAVVLNDQTEFTNKTAGPTATTVKFWKIVSEKFKNKPYVVLDLFNEPRIGINFKPNSIVNPMTSFLHPISEQTYVRRRPKKIISQAKIWKIWKYGGRLSGVNYVGMQTLVDQIRGYGVKNLIWVEGPDEARELPDSNYLLSGSNIVYSIHHPNLNNPASWNDIGTLSKVVPVVDGEWAQYQSPWAECYKNAYSDVPLYLNYLKQHDVGVIAWSLQAGSLLANTDHVTPTNINTKNDPRKLNALKAPSRLLPSYSCTPGFDQGVGQIIKTYFIKNSSYYSEPNSTI